MKLPFEIAEHIHDCLAMEYHGELSPTDFLGAVHESLEEKYPDESNAHWQLAVDLIYRLIKSEIIKIYPPGVLDMPRYGGNLEGYCTMLGWYHPFDGKETQKAEAFTGYPDLWMDLFYLFTDYGHDFMRRYNLFRRDIVLTPEYVNELEQRFEQYGVPWSDTPLIPIQPDKFK